MTVISKNFTAKSTETGGGGVTQITDVTLSAGSWSLVSGLYEYTYSNAAILANHSVDAIPSNLSINYVVDCEMLPQTEATAGSVKFFARRQPLGNISITLNLVSIA